MKINHKLIKLKPELLLDEYLAVTKELPGKIDYFRRMNENSFSHHLVNLKWFKELKADIEEATV